MNEWIGMGILFVSVVGLCFVALSWTNLRRSRTQTIDDDDEVSLGALPPADRGSESGSQLGMGSSAGSGTHLDRDSKPDFVLGAMTPALAKQIPVTAEGLAKLQPELRAAGFYGANALTQYLAIRTTLILMPLILSLGLAIVLDKALIPQVLIGGFVLALLGYSLPRVYINYLARERKRQIENGLPVAVDLLTLGITAGQNILFAFRRVSHELRNSYPVLAFELGLVHRQASLGSLADALESFADRVQVGEIRNLVMILTQSERLGTDISTGLLEFASNYRTNLRQRADTKANRATFWMLFPTLFCMFIPAALVLVGPIFFEFTERRAAARRALDSREDPEFGRRLGEKYAPIFDKSLRENRNGQ